MPKSIIGEKKASLGNIDIKSEGAYSFGNHRGQTERSIVNANKVSSPNTKKHDQKEESK